MKKSQNYILCLVISGGEIRIKAKKTSFTLNFFFLIQNCNKDIGILSKHLFVCNKDIRSESPFLVSQVKTAVAGTR